MNLRENRKAGLGPRSERRNEHIRCGAIATHGPLVSSASWDMNTRRAEAFGRALAVGGGTSVGDALCPDLCILSPWADLVKCKTRHCSIVHKFPTRQRPTGKSLRALLKSLRVPGDVRPALSAASRRLGPREAGAQNRRQFQCQRITPNDPRTCAPFLSSRSLPAPPVRKPLPVAELRPRQPQTFVYRP